MEEIKLKGVKQAVSDYNLATANGYDCYLWLDRSTARLWTCYRDTRNPLLDRALVCLYPPHNQNVVLYRTMKIARKLCIEWKKNNFDSKIFRY